MEERANAFLISSVAVGIDPDSLFDDIKDWSDQTTWQWSPGLAYGPFRFGDRQSACDGMHLPESVTPMYSSGVLSELHVSENFRINGFDVVGIALFELTDLVQSEPEISQSDSGGYTASYQGGLQVEVRTGWLVGAIALLRCGCLSCAGPRSRYVVRRTSA